jgi:DNA-binding transcriptional LysR family regulator
MTTSLLPSDLSFFSVLASHSSLSAASRDLGITTAAVSKHLLQLERRLGLRLVNRTTRRMGLTPEGEVLVENARRILRDIDALDERLTGAKGKPQGLLRVNATLGFGRSYIAPLISRFVREYPDVDVQLQLSANPPPLSEDIFDVCIRFGEPPGARVVARHIAPNRRILCAAPRYLEAHGHPVEAQDLRRHNCIGIRQGNDAYNLWRLTSRNGGRERTEAIKTRGNLSTNDGEIAVKWALDGHGIVMRAEWDVKMHLDSGELLEVLPDYSTPGADIYAVYPQRYQLSARVHVFVEFIADNLRRTNRRLTRV